MLSAILSNYSFLHEDPRKSLTAARRAVALDPLGFHAHCILANALFRVGAPEAEVMEQFAAAIELWPADADPYLERGHCLHPIT